MQEAMRVSPFKLALIRRGWLYFDQAGRGRVLIPGYVHRTGCLLSRWQQAIPFGGTPILTRTDLAIRPFFIVGSGRSGNTLLRRMLSNHSTVHIPPETYVLGNVIKMFRRNSRMKWRNLIRLLLAEFAFHREFDTFGITSLSPLVEELEALPKERRSLAQILHAFYCFHAKSAGISFQRWGDKTPVNAFCLERIASVFPNAQYVHMVRDGYDVVASYVAAGLYANHEHAAARWVAATRAVDQFFDKKGQGLTIRYEDLAAEPESTIRKVCEFLRLQFEGPMLADVSLHPLGDVDKNAHHSAVRKPVSRASIGKGKSTLTSEQYAQIGRIIGDQMGRLGYMR